MLCFYHILDEAGINAEVILKANKPEQKLIRKEFLRGLAYTLLTQWVTRRAQSTRGFKTRIVRAMSIVLGKEVKGIGTIFQKIPALTYVVENNSAAFIVHNSF